VGVVVVLVLTLKVPSGFALDISVEKAVLKGNWQTVVELLEKDDSKANDPVARLLMGHASLATNRNNAAMMLFLSVKEERDLQAWTGWTDSFARKHPQNPIALYLSADAKARTGKLEEAKEGFTQALEIKQAFALALNARGVIHVLTNDWDNAVNDFDQATKMAPELAEAHASFGTYWILRETPDAALEAFTKALDINPEFALAYNGRGAAYFGKGEFEKAAQDFRMASQLSPVLVVAEINQGFASAYASLVVALGSMEKRPGTTLEFRQQYQHMLKEEKQQLLRLLPTQQDQEFWGKINALPHLSDNHLQALVNEYGLPKVQMGAFLRMHELRDEIAKTNPKSRQSFTDKISFFNDASSFSFYSSGFNQNMRELWKSSSVKTPELSKASSIPPPPGHIIFTAPGRGPSGAISLAGHIALSLGGGRVYEMPAIDESGKLAHAPRITTWDRLIQTYSSVHSVPIPDATPNDIDRLVKRAYEVVKDPTGYYSEPYHVLHHNCIQSLKHLAKDVGLNLGDPNWKVSEHPWQFYTWLRIKGALAQTSSQVMAAAQFRDIETKVTTLNTIPAATSTRRVSVPIPGYYTSTDRPLTEVGALASMVDKGIKPAQGAPRTALIVSQDPFRTNLLQSELTRYGFQTRVISPGIDPQIAARQWGADVILGIRGTTEMKAPQLGRIPIEDPSKKYPDVDIGKKFPPPFPPDKGGGAAGIPPMTQPPITPRWDWGKSFIPPSPKGGPGGISTEEIAKAFVDKGNWPVMTFFSLFYTITSTPMPQKQEEPK